MEERERERLPFKSLIHLHLLSFNFLKIDRITRYDSKFIVHRSSSISSNPMNLPFLEHRRCFPLLFLCFDSLWKLCSRLRTRSFLSSFRKGVIFHMFEKYLFQPFEQFFFFLPLIENNIRIIFIELDESIFPFYAKMKETIGSRCREKFNFFYQRWQTKKNVIDFPSLYIISLPTITCLHFFLIQNYLSIFFF